MFEISGVFRDFEGWKKFRKIVAAESEKRAVEKVFSLIGSNHKTKRHLIKISEVKKVGEWVKR